MKKKVFSNQPQIMRVVLSVVSHNQPKLVNDLLKDIGQNVDLEGFDFTVVVTHNTLENELREQDLSFEVKEVFNLDKKGFGDNHNCVFENNRSDYFLVVNPDIRIQEKIKLKEILTCSRSGGVSSPIVVSESGVTEDYVRQVPTPVNLFKRHFWGVEDVTDQFWLAGMFLIFNSRDFEKLRGFDRLFFMYVEDCDICIRARKLNIGVFKNDSFSVVHSAQRQSRRKLRYLLMHVSSLFKFWIKLYFNKL